MKAQVEHDSFTVNRQPNRAILQRIGNLTSGPKLIIDQLIKVVSKLIKNAVYHIWQ